MENTWSAWSYDTDDIIDPEFFRDKPGKDDEVKPGDKIFEGPFDDLDQSEPIENDI